MKLHIFNSLFKAITQHYHAAGASATTIHGPSDDIRYHTYKETYPVRHQLLLEALKLIVSDNTIEQISAESKKLLSTYESKFDEATTKILNYFDKSPSPIKRKAEISPPQENTKMPRMTTSMPPLAFQQLSYYKGAQPFIAAATQEETRPKTTPTFTL